MMNAVLGQPDNIFTSLRVSRLGQMAFEQIAKSPKDFDKFMADGRAWAFLGAVIETNDEGSALIASIPNLARLISNTENARSMISLLVRSPRVAQVAILSQDKVVHALAANRQAEATFSLIADQTMPDQINIFNAQNSVQGLCSYSSQTGASTMDLIETLPQLSQTKILTSPWAAYALGGYVGRDRLLTLIAARPAEAQKAILLTEQAFTGVVGETWSSTPLKPEQGPMAEKLLNLIKSMPLTERFPLLREFAHNLSAYYGKSESVLDAIRGLPEANRITILQSNALVEVLKKQGHTKIVEALRTPTSVLTDETRPSGTLVSTLAHT